jgi:hypothetical protein
MKYAELDEDAVIACFDLAGRTGAQGAEIGYLNDEPPHGWYAHAKYRGARIVVEDLDGPVEAADALARRLLAGGKCTHCKRTVVLSGDGLVCRWRRMGPRWERGCAPAVAKLPAGDYRDQTR